MNESEHVPDKGMSSAEAHQILTQLESRYRLFARAKDALTVAMNAEPQAQRLRQEIDELSTRKQTVQQEISTLEAEGRKRREGLNQSFEQARKEYHQTAEHLRDEIATLKEKLAVETESYREKVNQLQQDYNERLNALAAEEDAALKRLEHAKQQFEELKHSIETLG